MQPVVDRPGGVARREAPTAFAHRGGATTPGNDSIENTLAAFADAVSRGFRHLETDVRASADGTVYVQHDPTMLRTTGDPRPIADLSDAIVATLRVAGREPVPTLESALTTFGSALWTIDVKADDTVEPVADLLERLGAVDRVCLGCFSHRRLRRIRERLPSVRTAASRREVAQAMALPTPVLRRMGWRPETMHVPVSTRGLPVLTDGLIRRAHALGAGVHVWTVDEPEQMHRLLDRGVDGLFTDRTDLLAAVLEERGVWPPR